MKSIILLCSILMITGCGDSIVYDPKNTAIGKSIIFKTKMFYAENLKSHMLNRESYKYGCNLVRENHVDSLDETHFQGNTKNITPGINGMRFTVKKTFSVTPWGLKEGFASAYHVVVVIDEKDKTCTFPIELVKDNEWL